jgi:transformation/transcription domain-associated protein
LNTDTEIDTILEALLLHFSLTAISEILERKENPSLAIPHSYLTLDAFVDGISKCISSRTLLNETENMLVTFLNYCSAIAENDSNVEQLPIFQKLCDSFIKLSYSSILVERLGGCYGINCMVNKMAFSVEWILQKELEIIKALFHVLKNATELLNSDVDEASNLIIEILKKCHPKENSMESQDVETRQMGLITHLISELSHPNQSVRKTVQIALEELAKMKNTEIADILQPVRERLLSPIFAKPLRALPFPMQIGNIDAITYCLSLSNTLLTFNEELLRLLHEALALGKSHVRLII